MPSVVDRTASTSTAVETAVGLRVMLFGFILTDILLPKNFQRILRLLVTNIYQAFLQQNFCLRLVNCP